MYFYSHPLISIISQYPVINEGALLRICEMPSELYHQEFSELKNEGHLIIGEHERIHLRHLTLTVSDRRSKRYIEEIDLKYISRNDLAKIIDYDKDKPEEDYHDGCYLEEEHLAYFEPENDLIIDLLNNEYKLRIEYADLDHNPKQYERFSLAPVIVQVDSYQVFANGFRMFIENEFPKCRIQYFTHAEYAWKYLRRSFKEIHNIQLIVTDISLHGINGVDFTKSVWNLEYEYNQKHIPIMALTMHGEGSPVREEALKENIFDKWFTKDVDPEVIGKYISSVIEY